MHPHSNVLPRPVNLVTLKMVREKKLGYKTPITQSEDAIELVRRLFKNNFREIVVTIGLDNANCPTAVHTVSLGSPDQAPVPISSVFKPLLLSNATAFILIHNHPGSSLVPSPADKELTERLKTIGQQLEITMLDHLILNADASGFYSFWTHRYEN